MALAGLSGLMSGIGALGGGTPASALGGSPYTSYMPSFPINIDNEGASINTGSNMSPLTIGLLAVAGLVVWKLGKKVIK